MGQNVEIGTGGVVAIDHSYHSFLEQKDKAPEARGNTEGMQHE